MSRVRQCLFDDHHCTASKDFKVHIKSSSLPLPRFSVLREIPGVLCLEINIEICGRMTYREDLGMSQKTTKLVNPCLFRLPASLTPDIELLNVPRSPRLRDSTQSADEKIADKLNEEYSTQFANETRDLALSKWHKKVAVLMFSWLKESNACLDTTEEVRLLGEVFREKYNYSVHEKWLSVSPEAGLPKHQLSLHFAQFIKEEDAKDALLIVYYGGHGFRGPPNEGLRIMGGNAADDFRTKTDEIVLLNSIRQFQDAEADILLILDCCFAGYLRQDVRDEGTGDTIFEYIGSSGKNQPARGPGPDSFTTALTKSLHDLATEKKEGFNVTTMLHKIQSMKSFTNNIQTPVCSELGNKPSFRRLKIVPIPQSPCPQEMNDTPQVGSDEKVRFSLNLQYQFTKAPTSEDITRLSRACKHLVRDSKMPIQQVVWNGISATNREARLAEAVIQQWASVAMKNRSTGPGLATSMSSHRSLEEEQARERNRLEYMSGRIDRLYDFVISRYKRTAMTSIVIAFALGLIVARRKEIARFLIAGRGLS